jgi:serine/threonine protein kinase
MGISAEFVLFRPMLFSAPNDQQTNILVTNDEPPIACLAGFDHMTITSDTQEPKAAYGEIWDAPEFKPPEYFEPKVFGLKYWVPTKAADIYAFGMTIFQVLTGETPFRSVRPAELGASVVKGLRPTKPDNAPDIRFSDLLWDFVQLCWDPDMKKRPSANEVMKYLDKAAENYWAPPSKSRNSSSGRSREELLAAVGSGSNDFPSVAGEPRVS